MADSPIAKKLQEMLNEEKWTRATLSGYTVNQIKELDTIFHEAAHDKVLDELSVICEEHLSHSKNSIAGLYLSGIIALSRQQIDDSNMVSLISIFADNRKWNVVEYVCNRILDYGENKHALQRLAECYQNEEKIEEKYAIWERLVRVDYEEADIVKLIAEKKEKAGDTDSAVDYYRKSLHRFVAKQLFSNVKEIWTKLVELAPGDIDFFFHVQKKIAKTISEDKAAILLGDLYKHYKTASEWDTAITILKTIIEYDEKNSQIRKEIVECYKAKFAEHSHVDEYIRISNLAQSYRNIHEAIADFEKHISFDVGNFVYHRTWNIGRIKSIIGDDISIDFAKKRDHHMGLKMAVESLVTLKKDHIWVLKAIWTKEKLKEKIKKDIPWALKTIIRSFDNSADIKKIKAELVDSVLTAGEWTSWSTKARDILKTDSSFGNSPASVNLFLVRDRPLSYEEKIYNQFKAEKNFFARIQNIRDFLDNKGDGDSEFFNEMLAFLFNYVRSYSQVNEQVIASHLFLKELAGRQVHLKNMVNTSFSELMTQCDDIVSVFTNIKDSMLKLSLLQNIKDLMPNWPEIYIRLFPYSLSQSMIDILLDAGEVDRLKAMVQSVLENYRDNREVFIWIVKNLWDETWVKEVNISYDKILITLIHILEITFKEIENHRDTTENKRINKQVDTILFKDGRLETFLMETDKDTIERIYALVCDVKDLDPTIKLRLRKKIQEKHGDFKFNDEEKTIVSRGLMVTARKYEEKNILLTTIMEVDVPANQKEIAYALSLGDLRENSEYKAAKEKQDELNAKVAKLKNEIERSQIFDKSSLVTSKISFGTEVVLLNEDEKAEELYIILGPWESDPSNHIISYLSPLGKRLLNHKKGDKLSFSIHDRKFNYLVKGIKATEF